MKNTFNLIAVFAVLIAMLSMVSKDEAAAELSATSYRVIKVNGKIYFVKTKSDMKQGDMYIAGTPITFANKESRAAIINKLKGRCVLTPAEKGKPKILQAANNIASRSGALLNRIDIKNHFAENYLVIGRMDVEIGAVNFPQDDRNFFYLAYHYNGELIHKKLSYEGNHLILDAQEIFNVDSKPIPVQDTEMSLYYMKNGLGDKLATFNPVFPDPTDLKSEIEIIMGEYTDKTKDVKVEEVTAYLNEFYGTPRKENLAAWLDKEFKM